MESTEAISRINPTDVPLARMTEAELDALVEFEAFDILDEPFRRSPAFRSVLANHTTAVYRVCSATDGRNAFARTVVLLPQRAS